MKRTLAMNERVPLPAACTELRMSRERVMRRINSGQLEGGQELGRWYLTRRSIERAVAERKLDAATAA